MPQPCALTQSFSMLVTDETRGRSTSYGLRVAQAVSCVNVYSLGEIYMGGTALWSCAVHVKTSMYKLGLIKPRVF